MFKKIVANKRINAEIESVSAIPDLKLIRPKVFPDERGFFCESYNVEEWKEKLNFTEIFKQVNISKNILISYYLKK